jgi:hypothetical protein
MVAAERKKEPRQFAGARPEAQGMRRAVGPRGCRKLSHMAFAFGHLAYRRGLHRANRRIFRPPGFPYASQTAVNARFVIKCLKTLA